MKKIMSMLLALAMTASMLVVSASAAGTTASYTDISDSYAQTAIEAWSGYGIVNGYGDGSFQPESVLTRAEAAKIIATLMGYEKVSLSILDNYTDVDQSKWYAKYIAMCVANGVMNGTSKTTMNPDGEFTFDMYVTMLCRALNLQESSDSTKTDAFSDSTQVASWAKGYMNTLVNAGYVQGVSSTQLASSAGVERQRVMMLMYKTITGYANQDGATVDAQNVNSSSTNAGITLIVADNVTVTGEAGAVILAGEANGAVVEGTATSASVISNNSVLTFVVTQKQAALAAAVVSGEDSSIVFQLSAGSSITVDSITANESSTITAVVVDEKGETVAEVVVEAAEAENITFAAAEDASAMELTIAEETSTITGSVTITQDESGAAMLSCVHSNANGVCSICGATVETCIESMDVSGYILVQQVLFWSDSAVQITLDESRATTADNGYKAWLMSDAINDLFLDDQNKADCDTITLTVNNTDGSSSRVVYQLLDWDSTARTLTFSCTQGKGVWETAMAQISADSMQISTGTYLASGTNKLSFIQDLTSLEALKNDVVNAVGGSASVYLSKQTVSAVSGIQVYLSSGLAMRGTLDGTDCYIGLSSSVASVTVEITGSLTGNAYTLLVNSL